jgi:quinol monooxygenase YgiN
MKAGLIAFHYPHPDHQAEMVPLVRRAAEVMAPTPGCLAAQCRVSQDDQAVVTTSQWDSEHGLAPSFAAVRTAGVDL